MDNCIDDCQLLDDVEQTLKIIVLAVDGGCR